MITASLRGFDAIFVAGLLNTMIWDLYARPEIKSAEQLKGKIVGTDRPGSPVAYGTSVALRKLGLTSKDVQLRILGGSAQIVAALLTGQIVAGAAAPPVSFQLDQPDFIRWHRYWTSLIKMSAWLSGAGAWMNWPRLVPLLRSVARG